MYARHKEPFKCYIMHLGVGGGVGYDFLEMCYEGVRYGSTY